MEHIKSTLAKYSPALRRDFLAILVKLAAKKLNMYTVRNDWRTKDGMLDFIRRNWDSIGNFINTDPCINWFCTSYQPLSHAFTDRKFALFIQDAWATVGPVLNRPDVFALFKYQSQIVKSLLESKTQICIPPVWAQFQAGIDLYRIIEQYKSGTAIVSPPQSPLQNQSLPQVVDDFSLNMDQTDDPYFGSGDGFEFNFEAMINDEPFSFTFE